MGTTPRSGRDGIRDIDESTASSSLQVSPYGGPLNNDVFRRKQMGKEADFLFTVIVGIPFWGLGEHEPLIIALFLPVVSFSNWRGAWTIKEIDWTYGTTRVVDLEFKQ